MIDKRMKCGWYWSVCPLEWICLLGGEVELESIQCQPIRHTTREVKEMKEKEGFMYLLYGCRG